MNVYSIDFQALYLENIEAILFGNVQETLIDSTFDDSNFEKVF